MGRYTQYDRTANDQDGRADRSEQEQGRHGRVDGGVDARCIMTCCLYNVFLGFPLPSLAPSSPDDVPSSHVPFQRLPLRGDRGTEAVPWRLPDFARQMTRLDKQSTAQPFPLRLGVPDPARPRLVV